LKSQTFFLSKTSNGSFEKGDGGREGARKSFKYALLSLNIKNTLKYLIT